MAKIESANGTTKKVKFSMNTSLEGGEVVGPDYDTDIATVPTWQANAWIAQGRCQEYAEPAKTIKAPEPNGTADEKAKAK